MREKHPGRGHLWPSWGRGERSGAYWRIFTQDQQAIIECVESRPWAYSNESAGRGYFNPSKRRGKKIQESWAVRLRSLMSHIDEIRVVYAVHEAGHAVVTVALGVILEQVTINSPEGGGYSRPDFFMYERVASCEKSLRSELLWLWLGR
jgi:hypothetical protein